MSQPAACPLPAPRFDGVVVELDVRDDLRHGREPFSRIMAAVEALAPDEVLHLRATFEPVPLLRVMTKRGFAHVTREEAPEDWSVWFHRPARDDGDVAAESASAPAARPADVAPATPAAGQMSEVVLDVRGLEPPEPMVRTLAALETLPAGAVLVQRNDRVPQFLLPILHERGFRYHVDDAAPDAVVVRISHAS